MKLTFVFLTAFFLNVSAKSSAQNVTLNVRNATLDKVFREIEKQTGYGFLYTKKMLTDAGRVTIDVKNEPVNDVLYLCFSKQPLNYAIQNNTIVISRKPKVPSPKMDVAASIPQALLNINGIVKDENGNPLAGVSVLIKGTNKGTSTGTDGSFSIEANAGNVLEFSRIGYQKKNVIVGLNNNITVVMEIQAAMGDAVVVVGYGTTLRKDLTGSVSTAPIESMQKAPVGSFAQSLEGRVAGVTVSSADAQPGSGSNIVIRGNNSITQSNSPLYVVDGFPIDGPNQNTINPNDIKSIEILKDASATAIYGSRGANGVILITTKTGKEGPPVVTLDATYGFQKVLQRQDLMDPYEFLKYQLEVSPGDASINGSAAYYYLRNGDLKSYLDTPAIDWQSKILRQAPIQQYNLAIRGGSKNTKYSISGNIFDQGGIIINSDYKRYQGRIVLDQKINDKLKVGINTNYSHLQTNGLSPASASQNGGSASKSMMYSVWGYRPFGAGLVDNGFDDNVDSRNDYRYNPVINQEHLVRTNLYNILSANAYLEYKITPHLQLRVSGGIYSNMRQSISFNDTLTQYGNPKLTSDGINGNVTNYIRSSWVNENTLTYDNTFNRIHRLKVLVGFTDQKETNTTNGSNANHLPEQASGVNWLSSGTPVQIQSGATSNTLASVLGRVNYTYNSKYLLTASFRADGSSKFAPENHWSYFPSGAFAWKFGDENFVKNSKIISNGKLRISYGVTGNNRVGDFAYLSQFSTSTIRQGYTFEGTPTPGTVPSQLGNAGLKWETTAQTDLGLDIGFLNDRIDLTVDAYRKKTTNLLLNANIPPSYGYSTIYKNIGSVQNQGLEFTLNTVNVKNNDFSWSSNFNISFNANKVLDLAENQHAMTSTAPFDNHVRNNPAFIAIVGQPLGLMYGPVWDGVYQTGDFDQLQSGAYVLKSTIPTNGNPRSTIEPGDIKYKDLNGDGVVNTDDFTVIGRGLPINSGGFNNEFTYKGFDLNIFLQWSYGNNLLNANRLVFEGNALGNSGLNQFASYAKRWTPDNPSNTLYRTDGQGPIGNIYSSRVIEDGSYLRLKTVSLGYNLPKQLLNRLKISSVRVYVSAQNLYTWTNYSGLDPEVNIYNNVLTPGVDFSAYPRARTVTFGANVSF